MKRDKERMFKNGQRSCPSCGTPFKVRSNGHIEATVDHIVPLAHGGTHAKHNLRLLCASCNQAKGDRENRVPVWDWRETNYKLM